MYRKSCNKINFENNKRTHPAWHLVICQIIHEVKHFVIQVNLFHFNSWNRAKLKNLIIVVIVRYFTILVFRFDIED